jgi:hypothetical protein
VLGYSTEVATDVEPDRMTRASRRTDADFAGHSVDDKLTCSLTETTTNTCRYSSSCRMHAVFVIFLAALLLRGRWRLGYDVAHATGGILGLAPAAGLVAFQGDLTAALSVQ